jgi:hypothetical protein
MTQTSEESLDDIARLLSMLVRRGMGTQNEAILAFVEAGISPARTAELVGTSAATVRMTQSRANKSVKKGKSRG